MAEKDIAEKQLLAYADVFANILNVGLFEGDEAIREHADHVIYIPRVRDALSAITASVPLQLLARSIAVMRGCDVDQPRNLAKSVTVE